MKKTQSYISSLKQILTHLKNSKLEYLRAADLSNTSEMKRFFNQKALIRNRFFQDVLTELEGFGWSYEDLSENGFAFDQLLISSIESSNTSSMEKCIQFDLALEEVYLNIIPVQSDLTDFQKHLKSIQQSLKVLTEIVSTQSEVA